MRLRVLTALLMTALACTSLLWCVNILIRPDYPTITDVGFSIMVNICIVPFLVIVVKEMVRYSHLTLRRIVIELGIPLALLAIYYGMLITGTGARYYVLAIFIAYMSVYVGKFIYNYIYAIRRYQTLISEAYADTEGRSINWTHRIYRDFIILAIMFFLMRCIVQSDLARILFVLFAVFPWLDIAEHVVGMREAEAVPTIDESAEEEQIMASAEKEASEAEMDDAQESDTSVKPVGITEKTAEKIMEGLTRLMEEQAIYRNPDLNILDVTNELGTNRSYVSYVLNTKLNQNFHRYVNSYRILHAQDLLSNTKEKVSNIAFDCGFNSPEAMTRIFKQQLGITPADYRRGTKAVEE